jgi:hypothetical protein
MKTFFLSAFLIVATMFTASAQLLPSFQFGIKGGANFSDIKDISLKSSSRTGYLVGAWARLGGAGVHFQPELYVTSKGAEIDEANQRGKVTFTTLDVPLLLGTRIGVGPIAARVQAGPVFSFVMNQDDSFVDNVGQAIQFDEYKNQTVAITGGVGVDIMKLRADLRYEHGVSDVFNRSGDSDNGRMSLWTLSVGYRIF